MKIGKGTGGPVGYWRFCRSGLLRFLRLGDWVVVVRARLFGEAGARGDSVVRMAPVGHAVVVRLHSTERVLRRE